MVVGVWRGSSGQPGRWPGAYRDPRGRAHWGLARGPPRARTLCLNGPARWWSRRCLGSRAEGVPGHLSLQGLHSHPGVGVPHGRNRPRTAQARVPERRRWNRRRCATRATGAVSVGRSPSCRASGSFPSCRASGSFGSLLWAMGAPQFAGPRTLPPPPSPGGREHAPCSWSGRALPERAGHQIEYVRAGRSRGHRRRAAGVGRVSARWGILRVVYTPAAREHMPGEAGSWELGKSLRVGSPSLFVSAR